MGDVGDGQNWTSYGAGSAVACQEPFIFPRLLGGGSTVQGSVLRQAGWSWLTSLW